MAYKTKYTYKGIEFASASKVVAQKAKQGDMRGAYQTYLSNTIIRQMTKSGMTGAVKTQWLKSLTEGLRTVDEAEEAIKTFSQIQKDTRSQFHETRSARRETLKEAEELGMSKKRRGSLQYQMYRKGTTPEEGQEIVDNYLRDEVAPEIRGNIYGQYASVFAVLRDSDDPELREVMKRIEDAIDKYALVYKTGDDTQSVLAKELKGIIENASHWESLSEKAVTAIENAMDSYSKVTAQFVTKESFKDTQLND